MRLQEQVDRLPAQDGRDGRLVAVEARPIFTAEPRYVVAALRQVRVSFGSIEAFFAEGLAIDAATQDALRAAVVDS